MSSNKPVLGGINAILRKQREDIKKGHSEQDKSSSDNPSYQVSSDNESVPQNTSSSNFQKNNIASISGGRPPDIDVAVHQANLRTATMNGGGQQGDETVGGHTIEHLPSTSKEGGRQNSESGRPPEQFVFPVDGKTATGKTRGRPPKKKTDGHRKGDRHSSNRARYDNRIDLLIYKQIKEFCVSRGIGQQEFAELSAVHFIRSNNVVDGHQNKKWTAHDFRLTIKDLYRTSAFIINLYQKLLPENRWKIADDREAERFNNADPRIVETAIIATMLRAKNKINSFKYFIPEIEYHLSMPLASETIDAMLSSARRLLGKIKADD